VSSNLGRPGRCPCAAAPSSPVTSSHPPPYAAPSVLTHSVVNESKNMRMWGRTILSALLVLWTVEGESEVAPEMAAPVAFVETGGAIAAPRATTAVSAFQRARQAAKDARKAADQLYAAARKETELDAARRIERAIKRARSHADKLPGHEFSHVQAAAQGSKSEGNDMDDERLRLCGTNCSGHGSCLLEQGGCQCFQGWRGGHCDAAACPNDCSLHGVCISGMCVCDSDFSGESCQSRRCPNECSGNGYCFNGRCQCTGNWAGTSCQDSALDDQDDKDLGMSEASEKSSLATLQVSSLMMENPTSCHGDCSGHGSCQSGACRCAAGWQGEACEIFLQTKPKALATVRTPEEEAAAAITLPERPSLAEAEAAAIAAVATPAPMVQASAVDEREDLLSPLTASWMQMAPKPSARRLTLAQLLATAAARKSAAA